MGEVRVGDKRWKLEVSQKLYIREIPILSEKKKKMELKLLKGQQALFGDFG